MITVLGAGGFIGSHIVKFLQSENVDHYTPSRNEVLTGKDLGDIIYCIGLTADFRNKPFDTVEAHVCKLSDVLQTCKFNSLTYLSSARVYINCKGKCAESAVIPVDPFDSSELYTLTKLTGERLCLSSGKKVHIIRLSNVYGEDSNSENFLQQILRSITTHKSLSLTLSLSSSKDYITIDDAVKLIVQIAARGRELAYNIASGINTSNEEIITELKKYFNFSVDLSNAAKEIIFPEIDIQKIKKEFGYTPKNILSEIHNLINKN